MVGDRQTSQSNIKLTEPLSSLDDDIKKKTKKVIKKTKTKKEVDKPYEVMPQEDFKDIKLVEDIKQPLDKLNKNTDLETTIEIEKEYAEPILDEKNLPREIEPCLQASNKEDGQKATVESITVENIEPVEKNDNLPLIVKKVPKSSPQKEKTEEPEISHKNT